MRNNQDMNKTSFIQGNFIKDIYSLIQKLRSSLKFQKEFLKEIEQNL